MEERQMAEPKSHDELIDDGENYASLWRICSPAAR